MYNELEQFILFLVCIYLGCLATFAVWFIKLQIERFLIRLTVTKAEIIKANMDKFDTEMNDLKDKVNNMDNNNLTLQDIQFLYYLHETTPLIKKYKDELEKEIVKITKQMEKQSLRLDNTFKVLNTFLGIISFGRLMITNKEEFY